MSLVNSDSSSFATRDLLLFVYNKEICNPSMIYYGFYLQNYLFCIENAQPFTPRCKRGRLYTLYFRQETFACAFACTFASRNPKLSKLHAPRKGWQYREHRN